MAASGRRIDIVANLLVVLSLLLGPTIPVLAQTPPTGAPETPVQVQETPAPAPAGPAAGERQGPTLAPAVAARKPAGVAYVSLDVDGPHTIGENSSETLQVRMMNLGPAPLHNAHLKLEKNGGGDWVGRMSYPLPDLEVRQETTVAVEVRAKAGPGTVMKVGLRVEGGNLAAEQAVVHRMVVRQDQAEVWRPAPGETTWLPQYDPLTVELPLARDARIATFSHQSLFGPAPGDPDLKYRFELKAYDSAGRELDVLAAPLVLRWRYAETPPPPGLIFRLLQWHADTQRWERLPATVDAAAGTITVVVDRLGLFGVAATPPQDVAPPDPFTGLEAQLFTGALTYNYPIPLFTRPGGFGPGLTLNYSSRRRDAQQEFGSSGSLLGWGWELEGISYITAVGPTTSRTYTLVLGGATYNLRQMAPAGNWYALEAPWRFRIMHTENNDGNPAQADENTWKVWAADGTYYEFTGFLTYLAEPCHNEGGRDTPGTTYVRWMVTRIRAAADQDEGAYSLGLEYGSHIRPFSGPLCGQDNWTHVYATEPLTITYKQGAAAEALAPLQVVFRYNDSEGGSGRVRTDRPSNCLGGLDCPLVTAIYYQDRILEDILLEAQGQVVRRYHFDASILNPEAESNYQRLFLNGVYEYGSNIGGGSLPVTPGVATPYSVTFTYTKTPEVSWDNGDAGRLGTITDRQGGKATFSYAPCQQSPLMPYCLIGMQKEDGLGGPVAPWVYIYSGWDDATGGNSDVAVSAPEGGWSTHLFYNQTSGTGTDPLGKRGQLKLLARQSDAGHGYAWLEQWDYDYMLPPIPVDAPYDTGDIVYEPSWTQHKLLDEQGALQVVGVTTYAYDLDHQTDQAGVERQAGNVTLVSEQDAGGLVRQTERRYVLRSDCGSGGNENAACYIVNLPSQQIVWDSNGVCQGDERYAYDDQASGVAPVRGLLTRVQAAQVRGAANDCSAASLVTQVENTYEPVWNNLSRTQNAFGFGADFGYDDVYHTFVVSSTNALAQTTTTVYDNPTDDFDQMQLAFGLAYQALEPSGQIAPTTVFTSTYDVYGRLVSLDRPLGADPDEAWVYNDYDQANGQPQSILHKQADGVATPAPQSGYLATWTYYDGLGRVVQTQGERDDAGTQTVVASRRYDRLGRLM